MSNNNDDNNDLENSKVIEANNQDQSDLPEIPLDVNENEDKEIVKDEEYYQKLIKLKEDEGISHLGRPLFFSKLIVRKTWLVLTITFTISLILSVFAIAFGAGQISEGGEREYYVWSDKKVKDFDMLELATEKLVTDYPNGLQPVRTYVYGEWATSVTFECSG